MSSKQQLNSALQIFDIICERKDGKFVAILAGNWRLFCAVNLPTNPLNNQSLQKTVVCTTLLSQNYVISRSLKYNCYNRKVNFR